MTKDTITEEDKALFRAHMKEVKPLRNKVLPPNDLEKPFPSKPVKPPDCLVEEKKTRQYHLSDYIQEYVDSETPLSYSIAGFPERRLSALKKGDIAWENRLDLHGLRTNEAQAALCRFIDSQAVRCVLIIHGKGGRQGEPPLIKNLVNRWLPQMDKVLAFCSARNKDGGPGAVYVLLKRKT